MVIGHRGAAAYAPEHTVASYEMAIEQGADALEQDLQVTRDGVLVCLHDLTLERTTNVGAAFPDRARVVKLDGNAVSQWFVSDFTLAELKRLDAGRLVRPGVRRTADPDVSRSHRPLWEASRALRRAKGSGGVRRRSASTNWGLFAAALKSNDLDHPGPGLSLVMQSFHEPTLRRAADVFDRRLPSTLLVEAVDALRWSGPGGRDGLREVATFATGIGPEKSALEDRPELVRWAHDAGLRVTPWTFRASTPSRFADVTVEMAHYLDELGVDAVITDNPDRAPRIARRAGRPR